MVRKVSVVIPTHNGMPRFRQVLDAILAQRVNVPFDVFCIDTASSDGTWEELERRGVRRARIAVADFDHGATRNRAISETDGDLVACTVQDATPRDDSWLQHLVDAVLSADDVAGAYSRQVPYDDVSPLLRLRLERWAAGRDEPRVQRLPPGRTLADYAPLDRLGLCAFDDVASIVRREVWSRFPIPSRPFGEDVAWAKSVIEAGYALAFAPHSVVVHSHDDGALAEFKRIYQDHRNLHALFGVLTVPTIRDAWRNSRAQIGVYDALLDGLDLSEDARVAQRRFGRRLAFAETFGQWLGARAVRKGPPRGAFAWIDRWVRGRGRAATDAS